MAKQVWPLLSRKNQLSALKGSSLLHVKVGLFTNDLVPTDNTALTDLTPATFGGYSLSPEVTWGDLFNGPDGQASMEGGLVQFIKNTGAVVEDIKGHYLVTSGTGPATLVYAVKYDTAIHIENEGDHVDVIPRVNVTDFPTDLQTL